MPETHRYTLEVGDDGADLVSARLWAAGALGLWEHGGELVAWFPAPVTDVPDGGRWSVEDDRDWQAEWKATISPVAAGRFCIVPTWLSAAHTAADDELTIVLDPGRAFGSGHHATTTQCLELLQHTAVAGRRVLDVGTGTGILAIGAALLGADEVVAVDIDPDAVEVARENAARNTVTLRTAVGSADTAGRYDVVLANLVTDTVVALAPQLLARLLPGGVLVVSGIAESRQARAVDALTSAGMELLEARSEAGWSALKGRRPAEPDDRRPGDAV